MNSRRHWFAIAAILGWSVACHDAKDGETRQASSCAGVAAPRVRVEGATIDSAARCVLLGRAFAALRSAPAELGIVPADSGDVLIMPLALADSMGTVLKEYWTIDISLPDRPHDAEVHIDRKTGAAEANRIHKPF